MEGRALLEAIDPAFLAPPDRWIDSYEPFARTVIDERPALDFGQSEIEKLRALGYIP
jgi:hypothetical protein